MTIFRLRLIAPFRVFTRVFPLLALFAVTPAYAVGNAAPIDVNRFHPATGSGRILTIDLADVGRPYELVPQLFLHYARLPLVFTLGDRILKEAVRDRVTADLAVSFSILRRLQLSLALPVTLYQDGDSVNYTVQTGVTRTLPPPATLGQEDLRLQVKGRFWSDENFGIGGALEVAFPTGNANSYLGSSSVTGTARLIGHYTGRRLTLGLVLGWRYAFVEEQLLNVKAGNSLLYGVGLQFEVYRYKNVPFYVLGELYGLAHYRFSTIVDSPVEAMFAIKAQVRNWTLFLGAGPGLDKGYGEPVVRAIAGAAYTWQYRPRPKPATPPSPVEPASLRKPVPVPPPHVDVPVEGDRLQLWQPIYFDFDRATINLTSYPLLDEVARVIRNQTKLGPIRIDGHTDNFGGDLYNIDLSQRRARAVYDYLLLHDVPAERLTYSGYGERCPLVPNKTGEHRAINRRVDFILVDREQHHPNPGECPASPIPPVIKERAR